ncbi:MAG: hypothetical protein WAL38_32335 [Solirubrobacteraceae bacterium]
MAGDQLVDRGDLCVQERDLPQAGIDRLALLERQLEISQPPAAHDAELVFPRFEGHLSAFGESVES